MSYLIIDTDTAQQSLYFDQLTQIEGIEYLLRFVWSVRESAWYLDLEDQDGNIIAPFIRLEIGWPLLRRFKDARKPPGLLMCIDTQNKEQEIVDPTDLGTRVLLTYITSDDPDLVTAKAS